MANKTLTEFIDRALSQNQSRDAIRQALLDAGWKQDEVRNALSGFADVDFPLAVPKPAPYKSAQIAFLYLLFFILLGIVAFSLGNLLFALVNSVYPAPSPNEWQIRGHERQIRSGISGLVVGAPLFFLLGRYLMKKRRETPELKRSQIRKWLTYITLVIAGATLVGDAISLVYNFLDGDFTPKFLLKSLIVALIAGSVFIYFLKDAEKGDEGSET